MEANGEIIQKLKEAFMPKNTECDGAACTGCWKDVIREAIKMLESPPPTGTTSKFFCSDKELGNPPCISQCEKCSSHTWLRGEKSAEEIYELGKKQIDYDRHLTLTGKERADAVLYFWMQGFKYCAGNKHSIHSILKSLYERVKHGDEKHQEWLLNEFESFASQFYNHRDDKIDWPTDEEIDKEATKAVSEFYGSGNEDDFKDSWRFYMDGAVMMRDLIKSRLSKGEEDNKD